MTKAFSASWQKTKLDVQFILKSTTYIAVHTQISYIKTISLIVVLSVHPKQLFPLSTLTGNLRYQQWVLKDCWVKGGASVLQHSIIAAVIVSSVSRPSLKSCSCQDYARVEDFTPVVTVVIFNQVHLTNLYTCTNAQTHSFSAVQGDEVKPEPCLWNLHNDVNAWLLFSQQFHNIKSSSLVHFLLKTCLQTSPSQYNSCR